VDKFGRAGQATDDNTLWSVRIACWKINPLNAKLNPICYFLALLGAHPILHVSRIVVKATNTHSEYVIFIVFSIANMFTRTRFNFTFIRILSVLYF
jgi:hypothetical protein